MVVVFFCGPLIRGRPILKMENQLSEITDTFRNNLKTNLILGGDFNAGSIDWETGLVSEVAGCYRPLPFCHIFSGPLYINIIIHKGRGGVRRKLCNFRVSVKVNHSTLVYIVYYNVQLLALIIYKCINYITLNTFLFYNIFLQVYMNNPIN